MAFLVGPAAPLSSAMAQMARSHLAEPFGLEAGGGGGRGGAVEAALAQLAGLMHRFMGILESLIANPLPPDEEDDFMKGWGEPGGDIESM